MISIRQGYDENEVTKDSSDYNVITGFKAGFSRYTGSPKGVQFNEQLRGKMGG